MNMLAHAENIADAASFFDGMRGLLPEEYRAKAEHHVERLHDAAQILAAALKQLADDAEASAAQGLRAPVPEAIREAA